MTGPEAQHQGVTLVLGYTLTDRPADYIPASDGYRPTAEQHHIRVAVPDVGLDSPQAWAEACFTATNVDTAEDCWAIPGAPEVASALADWWDRLSQGAGVDVDHEGRRSMSIGDTVTVQLPGRPPVTLACERAGWTEVTP